MKEQKQPKKPKKERPKANPTKPENQNISRPTDIAQTEASDATLPLQQSKITGHAIAADTLKQPHEQHSSTTDRTTALGKPIPVKARTPVPQSDLAAVVWSVSSNSEVNTQTEIGVTQSGIRNVPAKNLGLQPSAVNGGFCIMSNYVHVTEIPDTILYSL
ncbi:hypothetical protein CC80DRAFT_542608 [Byssothecium circinans]|uniref:Uncharacterized protein n=1 Tax=Byssothecium circinans TaxID=147558 RepID=A0A6A5UEX2_9PLEO|nr:hypothetical protein CC80DRAFT_542608 [Byssothecium circinans]